jgi:hypothetical protein
MRRLPRCSIGDGEAAICGDCCSGEGRSEPHPLDTKNCAAAIWLYSKDAETRARAGFGGHWSIG